jgi:hypothetical protein
MPNNNLHIIWTPNDARQTARDARRHRTIKMRPRRLRRLLTAWPIWIALLGIILGTALYGASTANADAYDPGCETVRWGFLGSQWRTICDGPKRADGSWERHRRIWYPAGWVSGYCGYYSCSAGHYREEGTTGYEEYVVFDSNVLPDEPGWLPTGSLVIR